MPIELLLGGRPGQWVLDRVQPADVVRVVTADTMIAESAVRRGIPTENSNINVAPPLEPVVAVCVHYPFILSTDTLRRYANVYNLHPSLLPWGRGAYAAFWSIWANEPAGASIHKMTARIDAGPVVDQIEVPVLESDTCASLHARIADAERTLFERYWPRLLAAEVLPSVPQPDGGSYHSIADYKACVANARSLDLVKDLFRLVRALTFNSTPSLTVDIDGLNFQMTVDISVGTPSDIIAKP